MSQQSSHLSPGSGTSGFTGNPTRPRSLSCGPPTSQNSFPYPPFGQNAGLYGNTPASLGFDSGPLRRGDLGYTGLDQMQVEPPLTSFGAYQSPIGGYTAIPASNPQILLTSHPENMTESGMYSSSDIQSIYQGILQRTIDYDAQSSPDKQTKMWQTKYSSYARSRSDMLKCQRQCNAAVLALDRYTVKPPETRTAEDSRQLVETHKANGTWEDVRNAGNEFLSATKAYNSAAQTTIHLAGELFLHGPDKSIFDVVNAKTNQQDREKAQVAREAAWMASNLTIARYNALKEETRGTMAFYMERAKDFVDLYRHDKPASAATSQCGSKASGTSHLP